MASEIRVNKIENRSGLGTVTFADTGVDLAGIVTATTFSGSGASLTHLPAANLTGTASAINGSNITNLPAANLTGTASAINGSNITHLAAANLTGTASAINGSNITNLPAANLTGTLSAVSAVNLTNIPAANLVGVCTSGLTKTGGFGKVLKVQQNLINGGSISSFAASSTSYQTMSEDTFAVVGTNTNLLVTLNIAGHMSASNADRNFRLAYKVGSGSYTKFGFNSNGSISENIGSDFRGDDIQHGMNISFSFLIDGTWNAGDVITVRLETVGEGTFYHNGSISATDVRFGNGLSKFIFTEYSD